MKEHFDGMLHERGIYIDERVDIGGNAIVAGDVPGGVWREKHGEPPVREA